MKQPNYLTKLNRMLAAGQIRLKGTGVHVLDVTHEDWCAIYQGKTCDCDPDVKLRATVVHEAENR
jgi:hypothetical protein